MKTGFDLVGAIFFTAEHAENAEIVVIPEQRSDFLSGDFGRKMVDFSGRIWYSIIRPGVARRR